jgi:hypothetical protein
MLPNFKYLRDGVSEVTLLPSSNTGEDICGDKEQSGVYGPTPFSHSRERLGLGNELDRPCEKARGVDLGS